MSIFVFLPEENFQLVFEAMRKRRRAELGTAAAASPAVAPPSETVAVDPVLSSAPPQSDQVRRVTIGQILNGERHRAAAPPPPPPPPAPTSAFNPDPEQPSAVQSHTQHGVLPGRGGRHGDHIPVYTLRALVLCIKVDRTRTCLLNR